MTLSFTPCLNWVLTTPEETPNRFSGFLSVNKTTAKAVPYKSSQCSSLKRGVNVSMVTFGLIWLLLSALNRKEAEPRTPPDYPAPSATP
jgi:hypothetical protein